MSENKVSGPFSSAAAEFGESSEKVNEEKTPNGKGNLPQHNVHKQLPQPAAGQGAAQLRRKWSASGIPMQDQKNYGFSDRHRSAPNLSGKKAQVINGNHLLNFRYDPISRPQSRTPPPRRQQKTKPYNKDLFLQANYRFVVLDSENYTPEFIDPDKMLQWEDIVCVTYSSPHPVQCPICLEYPLCPQITSCGHIFCFPCILRYLYVDQDDCKGDSWKKCPLCFVKICSKDLYTIYIEHVKNYCVGDTIDFMLLTRQKDSNVLSLKCKKVDDGRPCVSDEAYDSFSKFTFTSDVELSVRKAISDLDSWLVKADSGLVDDLERLTYVCAAMDQLEQRKKYWNEHRANGSNRFENHKDSHVESHKVMANAYRKSRGVSDHRQPPVDNPNKLLGDLAAEKLDDEAVLLQTADMSDSFQIYKGILSCSPDESSLQRHSNGSREARDNDLYNFYQAVDGQHFILHPLNMKCLLHHYGNYDMLPLRISGRILQLETVSQSEAMRRRYRYLSHFSLTTSFQFCEIDLREILPPDALSPFLDEIMKREKQRKWLARKEHMEKVKAEAATELPVCFSYDIGQTPYHGPPEFSMDDFEALGSPAVTSSGPPVGERRLFSSVTKLGYAAAHDSPALKIEVQSSQNSQNAEVGGDSSSTTGSRNLGMQSFSNVASRERPGERLEAPKVNEMGKKGKKPARVLMSTASSRRY